MSDTKLCVACAEEIKVAAKLCKHCNTRQDDPQWEPEAPLPENMVQLTASQRRVPQGSLSKEEWAEMESKLVEIGSEEHNQADTPFDPSLRPQKDSLVPADSVWAFAPWPGPLPANLIPGSFSTPNPAKFFGAIGNVQGWTYAEFERCAGAPFSNGGLVDGIRTVIWSHGSIWGAWSAAFYFDKYDICIGIGNETSF